MKKLLLALILVLSFFCLKAQQTVGLFLNTPNSFDGYTLFAPTQSSETYLIDNCGELVHSWSGSNQPGLSVYLLENSNLLRTGRGGGGFIQILDWNSNVLWQYSISSTHGSQHHDVEPLPNGNILIIAHDEYTQAEVEQAGGNTTNTIIESEQIVEIQPDLINGGATIVWEWKAWDHLIQDVDASKPNFGVIADNPQRIDINFLNGINNPDWLHFNAIDYNANLDQIVMSCPRYNEIWIIDHSTTTAEAASSSGGNSGKGGDLLYRWGNPRAYDQGNVNDQQLFFQHNPNWIPDGYPDAGKIILYNNRAGEPFGQEYSSVNIIQPPVDGNGNYTYSGGAYAPISPDWTYTASTATDFYSRIISGAERLENGNTIICEGTGGRFFEVDQAGNTVWEYVSPIDETGIVAQGTTPNNRNVFRVSRYAADYPGLTGQTLIPQGYIESGSTFTCTLYPEEVCEDFVNINTNLSSDTTIVADVNLTADNFISSPSMVTYHAGECIELQAGFEVALGTEFDAFIQGCPQN